ncbi:MAG: glycosyltransferase family 2 protein [Nitrospira sp.]|nr:glycosyltransferase family 2 protein [Nitrospira sp.]MDP3092023.1 glycosyltransferase family 2 protein [Nitrospira sp.]
MASLQGYFHAGREGEDPVTQEEFYRVLDLSIVIPAHNEATRILPHLRSIHDSLSRQDRSYEIIVVDDGSQDDTIKVVRSFAKTDPALRVIPLPTCMGKGGAVRQGMLAARGRLQLFTDADGATAITELDRLEQAIRNGADVAIGSRSLASRQRGFEVNARWHRSILGGCFNAMVRLGGIRGIGDTQCGFKLFERSVARDLFSVSTINGYGFDLELLFIAQQRGYRIAEVPVNWADQPGSKVRLVRDSIAMLREFTIIHRNAARGYYSPLAAPDAVASLSNSSPITE